MAEKVTSVRFASQKFYNKFKREAKSQGLTVRQLLEKGMRLVMKTEAQTEETKTKDG